MSAAGWSSVWQTGNTRVEPGPRRGVEEVVRVKSPTRSTSRSTSRTMSSRVGGWVEGRGGRHGVRSRCRLPWRGGGGRLDRDLWSRKNGPRYKYWARRRGVAGLVSDRRRSASQAGGVASPAPHPLLPSEGVSTVRIVYLRRFCDGRFL